MRKKQLKWMIDSLVESLALTDDLATEHDDKIHEMELDFDVCRERVNGHSAQLARLSIPQEHQIKTNEVLERTSSNLAARISKLEAERITFASRIQKLEKFVSTHLAQHEKFEEQLVEDSLTQLFPTPGAPTLDEAFERLFNKQRVSQPPKSPPMPDEKPFPDLKAARRIKIEDNEDDGA